MVNTTQQNNRCSTGITRRTLLEGLGAFSVLSFVAPLSVAATPATDLADTFMQLSMRLTEVKLLNPALSQRLYQALKSNNAAFDGALHALDSAVNAAGTADLTAVLAPTEKRTAKAILSAWYTGIVGEGLDAKVITYRHALQFKAVDDVLVIRSYCPNKPGFWASQPTERNA